MKAIISAVHVDEEVNKLLSKIPGVQKYTLKDTFDDDKTVFLWETNVLNPLLLVIDLGEDKEVIIKKIVPERIRPTLENGGIEIPVEFIKEHQIDYIILLYNGWAE